MKKRIAKKVLDDPRQYNLPQYKKACKRLGNPWVVGIDMAAEGATDYTYTTTGSVVTEDDTVVSHPTISTAHAKNFHYRTGKAPTTPGAIQVTPFNFDGVDPKIQHAYDGMTLPELRAYAKEHGVKGYSTLKKDDLLALIKGG
jgi:hypothetical protein